MTQNKFQQMNDDEYDLTNKFNRTKTFVKDNKNLIVANSDKAKKERKKR